MPKKRRKKANAQNNNVKNLILKTLFGSIVNILIYFSLCAAAALICLKTDTDSAIYKYIVPFICAVSGFFGGFKAVNSIRMKGMLFGAISALPAFLIIFLISSIISRTGIAASGWIAAIIMTVFSAVGGILSANQRK